jgi:hypothetical protein
MRGHLTTEREEYASVRSTRGSVRSTGGEKLEILKKGLFRRVKKFTFSKNFFDLKFFCCKDF